MIEEILKRNAEEIAAEAKKRAALGAFLSQAARKIDKNASDLAHDLGVHRRITESLLAGEHRPPDRVLKHLARELCINLEQLQQLVGPPTQSDPTKFLVKSDELSGLGDQVRAAAGFLREVAGEIDGNTAEMWPEKLSVD